MPKWYTKEDALKLLQRYCAYQDRCHKEVKQKLYDMGVYPDWQDEIILSLLEDNFLNEERFACSFARGKFRMKQWGRQRIQQELKQRQITAYCIKKAMQEIKEADYRDALHALVEKKASQVHGKSMWERKQKVARFIQQRGFEPQLFWPIIHDTLSEDE
jgi:regulatory protein